MIRPATPADLPALRRLWQGNRYSFVNCGLEDLPDLLGKASAVVGLTEEGGLWGFVAFETDSPQVLPGSLQDGALRALLLAPQMPPDASADRLFAHFLASRQAIGQPFQLTGLTDEEWLIRLLEGHGFSPVDRLCLYQRVRRTLPAPISAASLRPASAEDIPGLIALDAAAFDPLWRISRADLLELFFASRIHTAEVDGQLAGYAATSLHPDPDGYGENETQITRVAVHPAKQGRGIGRQLTIDAIAYAHANRCYRILLNTPESNAVSQRLYESLHFRRHGTRMSVFRYAWPFQKAPTEAIPNG